ncbi:MAG: ATP-binding protein [Actinomycetes bacterium]
MSAAGPGPRTAPAGGAGAGGGPGSDPVGDAQDALVALERRRWQLYAVAAFLLVSVSVAVGLVLTGDAVPALAAAPALRYGFLVVSLAFVLYAFDQERTLRRMTRTILAQVRTTEDLAAQVADLTTLVRAAREVTTGLDAERVHATVLDAALELVRADSGAVLLRVGEELTVAVREGAGAPALGTRIAVGEGPVGRCVARGAPERVDGTVPGVAAPIVVRGRRVGALALQRAAGAAPFEERDVALVVLFAEQAASAVANADRFEQERARVASLVEAGEQRAEFVARLVHDLRAPLSAVSGYAQLLRDRGDRLVPAQREEALAAILEQTGRLDDMVGEVLSATAAEAGADVAHSDVDLGALLERACTTVEAATRARGDARHIDLAGAEHAGVVRGDTQALLHVVTNLLDNAVKYSPAGAAVGVRVERGEGDVTVHVVDRGRGIPEDRLADVFTRFRRASDDAGGVGLGLYIVRALVKAHGGRVAVRSQPGTGSVFSVTLPQAPTG